jgi:hypothetical protein
MKKVKVKVKGFIPALPKTGAFSKKGQRFFRKPAENTGKYLKTGANG